MSVDCPHTNPMAGRGCAGCTETAEEGSTDREVESWCDGEITGRVYRDSDGDIGVINGVRQFLAVEDEEASCKCELTDAEWEKAREDLIATYDGGDGGLADLLEDEARRETGR